MAACRSSRDRRLLSTCCPHSVLFLFSEEKLFAQWCWLCPNSVPQWLGGKEFTSNAGRRPGGGHGHPRQRSCLESPTGGGARRAAVHGLAESRTQLRAAPRSSAFELGSVRNGELCPQLIGEVCRWMVCFKDVSSVAAPVMCGSASWNYLMRRTFTVHSSGRRKWISQFRMSPGKAFLMVLLKSYSDLQNSESHFLNYRALM